MKQKQLTILFIIIIGSLSIINLISPSKSFSEKENRYLQQIPKPTWTSIKSGDFSSEFEKYTGDQFIFRDSWIGLKTLSEKVMLKKDNGRVYFGKENYLFDVKEDLDEIQYDKNINYLNQFVANLDSIDKKIEITALLIPTKASVLKDKLPTFAPIVDEDVLFNDLEKDLDNDIKLVNPQKSLSLNQDTYYKSDHHWTSFGAYLGYKDYLICRQELPLALEKFNKEVVSEDFLGTSYRKANLFSYQGEKIEKYTLDNDNKLSVVYNDVRVSDSLYDASFLEKTDKYAYFMGGDHALVKISNTNVSQKKLLIVKDSFANSMIPFLSNHYKDIYVVDTRHFNGSILNLIEENNIKEVLMLYNIQTLVSEKTLVKLNK